MHPSGWALLLIGALTSAAGVAQAQSEVPWEDLSEGTWRYRPLADGPCVSPAIDDEHWPRIALPNARDPLDTDAVCFRREVSMSGPGPWAVVLGTVNNTRHEVWVDGVRVSAESARDIANPRAVEIPSRLVADGHAVIALRTWRRWQAGRLPVTRFERGRFGFGHRELAHAALHRTALEYSLARLYPSFALVAISTAMAIFFLALGVRRELSLYRWFGLLVLVGTSNAFVVTMARATAAHEWQSVLEHVEAAAGFAIGATVLEFLWRLVGQRRPRFVAALQLWYLAWLVPAGALGKLWLVGHVPLWFSSLFFTGPYLVVLGWMVWHARRNRAALTVVIGFVVALAMNVVGSRLAVIAAWDPRMYAGLVVMVAMAIAAGQHYVTSLRDLAETSAAAQRFVPNAFLELLDKRSLRDVREGDQTELELSILFSDLRGFTTRSEKMGPKKTFEFINRYFKHMESAIHAEGGFINDIYGDGIMALFHGSPDAAVRAALGMQAALERFNAETDGEPARMGIGIHRGRLMLGTIGGVERLDCTVVGDPANVASRIEGLTKDYDAHLLVSDAVVDALEDRDAWELREVDRVAVRGTTEPIGLYEVVSAPASS